MEASLGPSGPTGHTCHLVPVEALRTQPRQVAQTPVTTGRQAARKMDERQLSTTIRSTCQSTCRISPLAQGHSGDLPSTGAQVPQGGPKIFRPEAGKWNKKYVIELFSGCARLSQACARHGYVSLAYDIEYGASCDLLNPSVLQQVQRFITQHSDSIALVWFGTPCTSWSMARRNDGGPPPLRDNSTFLFGFPDLPSHDAKKVLLGNQLLDVTTQLISLAASLQLRWVLENPYTSRIWLTPALQHLRQQGALFLQVDFCAFGEPWRKSTGLLAGNFSALAAVAKTCASTSARCIYSGKRHIILAGKDSAGMWWTRRAQPYPLRLCASIASCLPDSSS